MNLSSRYRITQAVTEHSETSTDVVQALELLERHIDEAETVAWEAATRADSEEMTVETGL